MLNSRQVKELFEQKAILMGRSDAMPVSAAIESAGSIGDIAFEVAVDNLDPRRHLQFFGNFDTGYSAVCFTFDGFQHFISYANALELKHIVELPKTKNAKVIDLCTGQAKLQKSGKRRTGS